MTRLHQLTAAAAAAPDATLLEAFLQGDQGAFALLVRRHAGLVFATCRHVLRHQQDAEDAFQATFLVLARRAGAVRPREAVGAWLFGVARRVALKARRGRARRGGREERLGDVAGVEPERFDSDLADAVHRVVWTLPDVYRAAVVACDLQGLSRKEAAGRLGWTEGTLSGRLARARALLATRLRRHGVALPAAGLAALLGAPDGVSAATVRFTVTLATGASAAAPVTTLAEGVVRGMSLFQFQTAFVAVLIACALAIGAFTAVGAATDDGPGPEPQSRLPVAPPEPAVANPGDPAAKARAPLPKHQPDLVPFQGEWLVVDIEDENRSFRSIGGAKGPAVLSISGSTLKMPYRETDSSGSKSREYQIAVEFAVQRPNAITHRNTIDLIASNEPVGRGIYEFTAPASTCAACHSNNGGTVHSSDGTGGLNSFGLCGPGSKVETSGLRLALSVDGKRPTKFGGEGVIVFELKRLDRAAEERMRAEEGRAAQTGLNESGRAARLEPQLWLQAVLERAEPELQQAKLQFARAAAQFSAARIENERAVTRWAEARQRWLIAEQEYESVKERLRTTSQTGAPGRGAPVGAVFTVHVRTLTSAEKVIQVKVTGRETALGALAYAADDVPIKSASVTVWVVRDRTVLPVDLTAITKNGDTKTDHTLRAGDHVFVQEALRK